MLRLKVYDGQEPFQDIELQDGIVTIGREAGNTLVLPDVSVSRRHAQVEPHGNYFLLRDNGSTNGTFVNEMLVRAQVLNHGDTIRIGKYLLQVEARHKKTTDTTRVRVEALRFPGEKEKFRAPAKDSEEGMLPPQRELALTETSSERLLRLYEIQKEIGYIDSTQGLLDHAVEIILEELKAERGSVLLLRAHGAGAEVEAGNFVPASVRFSTPPVEGAQPAEDLVIPQDLLLEATTSSYGARAVKAVGGEETGARACLVSPLRERNVLRGAVYVDRSSAKGPFSEEDLQFLNAVSGKVAISLANAELFDQVSLERQKMQAVFTSLTDGILILDRDLKVLEANSAATLLLGLESVNPLGSTLSALFSSFKMSPGFETLQAAISTGGAIFHLTREQADSSDAKPALITGRIMPYPRACQDPAGALAILKDRSDTQKMEELKTKFIGNFAHKLRTPLTVIQGSLPLLKDPSGGLSSEMLEAVERSSGSLCRLIDQFVEIKSLVRQAVKLLDSEAGQKGVVLTEMIREDVPLVSGRSEHLQRAFQQILDNSVKFCPQGGQVTIEAQVGGGAVRVDFVDDGPGIPREQIESVFYVGHQVDPEGTGQVPGAGLGLTMARHIVQEHGGEIEVTSPFRFSDHGTRVSVLLPLRSSSPLEPKEMKKETTSEVHIAGTALDPDEERRKETVK
jgi:signal transduction histidine kinase